MEVRMSGKRKFAPTKLRPVSPPPTERLDVAALAAAQGVQPISDPSELAADFWPEEESADQFIAAVRQWRREKNSPRNAE